MALAPCGTARDSIVHFPAGGEGEGGNSLLKGEGMARQGCKRIFQCWREWSCWFWQSQEQRAWIAARLQL